MNMSIVFVCRAVCKLHLGVILRLLLAQLHSTCQRQQLDADYLVPDHPLHAPSSVWLRFQHESKQMTKAS